MSNQMSDRYRKVAEEFAERVVAELGDEVEAIVLYGSVARGTAAEGSEIDLLVVEANPIVTREKVDEICDDYLYKRDFHELIILVQRSENGLKKLVDVRSQYFGKVVREGVVLHDNGVFARVLQRAARAGAGSDQ